MFGPGDELADGPRPDEVKKLVRFVSFIYYFSLLLSFVISLQRAASETPSFFREFGSLPL